MRSSTESPVRLSINKPVDVEALLKKLSFVEEEVSTAAREQPTLFMQAARLRVQKLHERERAEARLKLLKSQKAQKIRNKIAALGDRATEGRVGELLAGDKEIRLSEKALHDAEEEEEYAKLLVEGFRMRRDSLKVIVEMVGAEVYVQRALAGDSTELRKIHNKLESKYPGVKKKRAV